MKKDDKTFLQKVKENGFYIALGIGLFALLAVVGVYTAQQNELQVAQQQQSSQEELILTDEEINVAQGEENVWGMDEFESGNERKDETIIPAENDSDVQEDGTSDTVAMEDMQKQETTDEEMEETTSEQTGQEETSKQAQAIPTSVDPERLDFNSEKTITWPVNGEVILPYSMETTVFFKTLNQYQCNPGMLIKAGTGTTVKNAYLGKVTNVTSDNTYGNMVTLYIGNEYSIVYGQLDAVYVKEGDFVQAGQSIGTVANPTDSFSEEGSHLFFQMKSGEEYVDPMLYIE